uniref:Homing endonuclease LAGLIDADG domain-containing protein n=1 Tax=Cryphonectria parasitica TaxID=5116 RepID=A0A191MXB9_CRYPA|nr:hypothetical protein [Cryphonectria parasitica]
MLRFKLGLNERDKAILENIITYLGCGTLSFNKVTNSYNLTISSLGAHINKIIPLFDKNPIQGVKALDYLDWRKVAFLMKEGLHLTEKGLKEIQSIKAGMNKGRKVGQVYFSAQPSDDYFAANRRFYFKGINISCINELNSKVKSILKDKNSCNSIGKGNNNDKEPYSLLVNSNNMNINNIDRKDLVAATVDSGIYSILMDMEEWLSEEYSYNNTIKKNIYIGIPPFNISIKDFNSLVIKHNKGVNMPKLDEYKLEKLAYLGWRGYNTPSVDDFNITPLVGTSFYDEIQIRSSSSPSSLFVYNQWKVASYYLILEYNILNKAFYYVNNINSNLPREYQESYTYWMNRQINLSKFENIQDIIENNSYIIDITIYDNFYREICEDYLYLLLNILLANSIINNTELVLKVNNEKLFFDHLKSIIEIHYNENIKGYECLKELRIYSSNYFFSVNDLCTLYKNTKK